MVNREISVRDIILAIVGYSPSQRVEGRTRLQKLAYFSNILLKLDIPYQPGYYGPYSEVVAKATDSLVALGFLVEEEERYSPGPSSVFEPRKYIYTLTSEGNEVFDSIRAEDERFFEGLNNSLKRIRSHIRCNKGGDIDYVSLSLAAKMYHILETQQPQPMNKNRIMSAARELRWNLDEISIGNAADFLVNLDMIKETDSRGD